MHKPVLPVLYEDLPDELIKHIKRLGVYELEIYEALDIINNRKSEPDGMMTDVAVDIIKAWLEEGD